MWGEAAEWGAAWSGWNMEYLKREMGRLESVEVKSGKSFHASLMSLIMIPWVSGGVEYL